MISPYRQGVGIVLLNQHGQVFSGARNDVTGDHWQCPQGGIDEGESPLQAAMRELKEEVGTSNAKVIQETIGWIRYDFPPHLAKGFWFGQYKGQEQKWFLLEFKGKERDINIETDAPEFKAWKWMPFASLIPQMVDFKRHVYEQVGREFSLIT